MVKLVIRNLADDQTFELVVQLRRSDLCAPPSCDLRVANLDRYAHLKMREVIYFLYAEGTGLIKIGKTDDLRRRMQTLHKMSPVPLTLLKVVRGYTQEEHELHQRFAQYRHHGEWFEFAPLIIPLLEYASCLPDDAPERDE